MLVAQPDSELFPERHTPHTPPHTHTVTSLVRQLVKATAYKAYKRKVTKVTVCVFLRKGPTKN